VLLPSLASGIRLHLRNALISARAPSQATTAPPALGPDRARLHVADLLLPASLALWAVRVKRTNTTALGPYELLTVLPIVFYAGSLSL
jgi:hypothetical protein